MTRTVWRAALLLSLVAWRAPLCAQFLGIDDAPDLDEEFIDSDSATVYYLRYSVGYSAISAQREFRRVVAETFERRFGAPLVDYSNAIASGIPIGVSAFRKHSRLFAYGLSAFISPVVRTSAQRERETSQANGAIASSSEAFFQSFSLEAVGEFRFKALLLDFGVGVQTQRIGDDVRTEFYDETSARRRIEESKRRAWIFSPTYFFAIGLDFFAGERFSVTPMYKSFYWRYGSVRGSSDWFLLALRANL